MQSRAAQAKEEPTLRMASRQTQAQKYNQKRARLCMFVSLVFHAVSPSSGLVELLALQVSDTPSILLIRVSSNIAASFVCTLDTGVGSLGHVP